MNKQHYIFEATNSGMQQQTIWFGLISLLLLGLLVWLYKKEVSVTFKNHKRLLLLLGAFLCLITLSSAFFSWWTVYKIKDITIDDNKITTPYGETTLDNFRRIYFHQDFKKPRFSTNIVTDTIQFLILEEYNKKTHALSEENYNVKAIFETLTELTKEKIE